MVRSHFISRLTALAGLTGVAAASLSGCGGGGGSSNNTGSTGRAVITVGTTAGRAACAANAHVSGRARWTVLVYLNSSNNLNDGDPAINGISDALNNVAQMAKVGSDSNVNIVVQWKQANYGDTSQTPTFNETRRYLIKPHSASDVNKILAGNTTVLDSDLIPFPVTNTFYNQNTKQVDMGDWRVLQDFVNWGSTTYPADNLAVVVWDHGSGWEPVPAQYRSVRKPVIHRAVSLDSQMHTEIETEQIPGALSQAAQPIDALIFDASLMQMAEIEYQVRNSAKVMVGSEESPPGAGYPYDQWINDLKTTNIADSCALGISITTRFVNNYNIDGITQSVIDLSKMQAVATALDNFGGALITHRADQAPVIRNARVNAQAYKYLEFKDLNDFANQIRVSSTAADLQQAAAALQTALTGSSGAIIANGHNQNEPGSYGMAITVPDPNLNLSIADSFTSYLNLAISQQGAAPRWYQFCVQQVQ